MFTSTSAIHDRAMGNSLSVSIPSIEMDVENWKMEHVLGWVEENKVFKAHNFQPRMIAMVRAEGIDGKKLLKQINMTFLTKYFYHQSEKIIILKQIQELRPSTDSSTKLGTLIRNYKMKENQGQKMPSKNEGKEVVENKALGSKIATYKSQLNESEQAVTQLVNSLKIFKFWEDTCGEEFAEVMNNLVQEKSIEPSLMFVGMMNVGKSTLINTILGAKILPSTPFPTTFHLICLKYGDQKKVEIYYNDGSTEEIDYSLDAMLEVISKDKRTKESFYHVDEIHIYWPNSILKSGLTIIDTPGFNESLSSLDDSASKNGDISIIEKLKMKTKHASTLVLVLSKEYHATPDTVNNFISDVVGEREKNSLFVVLNKIDEIPERDFAFDEEEEEEAEEVERDQGQNHRVALIKEIKSNLYSSTSNPLEHYNSDHFFALSCRDIAEYKRKNRSDMPIFSELLNKLFECIASSLVGKVDATALDQCMTKALSFIDLYLFEWPHLKERNAEIVSNLADYGKVVKLYLTQQRIDMVANLKFELEYKFEQLKVLLIEHLQSKDYFQTKVAVTKEKELQIAKNIEGVVQRGWNNMIERLFTEALEEYNTLYCAKIQSLMLLETSGYAQNYLQKTIEKLNVAISFSLASKIQKKYKMETVKAVCTLGLSKLFTKKKVFDEEYIRVTMNEHCDIAKVISSFKTLLQTTENELLSDFAKSVEDVKKMSTTLSTSKNIVFSASESEQIIRSVFNFAVNYSKIKHLSVNIGKYISQGGFGVVFHADVNGYNSQTVAKIIRNTDSTLNPKIEMETIILLVAAKIWKCESIMNCSAVLQISKSDLPTNALMYLEPNCGENLYVLLCEYIPGTTVGRCTATLKDVDCLFIAKDLCTALLTIHNKGLVHRDLHSENVMVYQDNSAVFRAKVIDMGCAKPDNMIGRTITNNILFMSPETRHLLTNLSNSSSNLSSGSGSNKDKVTHFSDIYSYGKILDYLLNLRKYEPSPTIDKLKMIASKCSVDDKLSRMTLSEANYILNNSLKRETCMYIERQSEQQEVGRVQFFLKQKLKQSIDTTNIATKSDVDDILANIESDYQHLDLKDLFKTREMSTGAMRQQIEVDIVLKKMNNYELKSRETAQEISTLYETQFVPYVRSLLQNNKKIKVGLLIVNIIPSVDTLQKVALAVYKNILRQYMHTPYGVSHTSIVIGNYCISFADDAIVHVHPLRSRHAHMLIYFDQYFKEEDIDPIQNIISKYNYTKQYLNMSNNCQNFVEEIKNTCNWTISNPIIQEAIAHLQKVGWEKCITLKQPRDNTKIKIENHKQLDEYMAKSQQVFQTNPDYFDLVKCYDSAYHIQKRYYEAKAKDDQQLMQRCHSPHCTCAIEFNSLHF